MNSKELLLIFLSVCLCVFVNLISETVYCTDLNAVFTIEAGGETKTIYLVHSKRGLCPL